MSPQIHLADFGRLYDPEHPPSLSFPRIAPDMTSLQTHTKPSLHLSLAPDAAGPSHASRSTPSPSSRRVPSWGSAASDTFSRISAIGDRSLDPLPSPLESREWGFLPESSLGAGGDSSRLGGTGTSWLDGWGGSIGTSGGKGKASEGGDGSSAGGSWMSSGANEFGAFPTVTMSSDEKADDRSPPNRSKTLSFFDTGLEDSSRALSPPPNPPSRQNSLSSGHRRGPSSSSAPPPSPGWESLYQPALDPLRSSVASSTGSWLDDASGEGTSSPWARGRVESVGSTAGARSVGGAQTPRNESPRRMDEDDEPSPVAALRPRLAALETASLQTRHGSPSPVNFPAKPMSSLPTAVDAPRLRFYDLTTAPSSVASSSRSSSRRQFVSLDEQPSPADSPPRSARSSSEMARSPAAQQDEVESSPAVQVGERLGDYVIERLLGKGAFSRVALARMGKGKERAAKGHARTASRDAGADGGLVALKMIGKKGCESNERMRISVLREVEVLKVRGELALGRRSSGCICTRADTPTLPRTERPPPLSRLALHVLLDTAVHRPRPRVLRRRRAVRLYRRLAPGDDGRPREADLWRAVFGSRVDARDWPRPSRHQAREWVPSVLLSYATR